MAAGMVFPEFAAAQDTQSSTLSQSYQNIRETVRKAAARRKSSSRAVQAGIVLPGPRRIIKKLTADQMKKLKAIVLRVYKKKGSQGVIENGRHEISFTGEAGKRGSFTVERIFFYTDKGDREAPLLEIDPHGGITATHDTFYMGGFESEALDISRPTTQRTIRKELHFWLETDAAKAGKIGENDSGPDISF